MKPLKDEIPSILPGRSIINSKIFLLERRCESVADIKCLVVELGEWFGLLAIRNKS